MKLSTLKLLLIAVAGALFLLSCQTGPPEIPEDMSQAEMFQRAQEALDDENYDAALAYYREFLERFPEDTGNRMAARYEIAFIYYKKGDYDTAEQQFQDLLAEYEEPVPEELPVWPRVLAEKLLDKIEERRQEQLVQESGTSEEVSAEE